MSNMTRTAQKRAQERGLTEEAIRRILQIDGSVRIGTDEVEQAATSGTGIQSNKAWDRLNFPVELKQIQVVGEEDPIPGRRAIVRTDTGDTLNIVSERYKLVPHVKVFEPVAAAIADLGIPVKRTEVSLANGGAFARIAWELNIESKVVEGDKVTWMVIGRNSYDYESILGLEFGAYRYICSNGLKNPIAEMSSGGKHLMGLSVEEAIQSLEGFLSRTDEVLTVWRNWAGVPFTEDQLRNFLQKKSGIAKRNHEEVIARYHTEDGSNLWDAYNALTWFATHKVVSRADRAALTQDRLQEEAVRFALRAA